jgi:hypothetical protein
MCAHRRKRLLVGLAERRRDLVGLAVLAGLEAGQGRVGDVADAVHAEVLRRHLADRREVADRRLLRLDVRVRSDSPWNWPTLTSGSSKSTRRTAVAFRYSCSDSGTQPMMYRCLNAWKILGDQHPERRLVDAVLDRMSGSTMPYCSSPSSSIRSRKRTTGQTPTSWELGLDVGQVRPASRPAHLA